jgi:rare lipoprotein A (peptidoglycan hydrolase)
MPMPRVIGISLACLFTSACAVTRTAEKNTSHYSVASADFTSSSTAEMSTLGTGISQFGKATWYDLVGRETASGEILNTVTATAANRSLPLDSFAKVTDLDNGRSVIVKINDRGPFARGRVIDLSPRAAEALHIKAAGLAAVIVEPIEN